MTVHAIAFIGLGNMGLPMARNLMAAGHRVTGFDVGAGACEAAAVAQIPVAPGLAQALKDAEIAITMLPAGDAVRAVYLGPAGILSQVATEALLIDCSTIDVETARSLHQEAASREKTMVDAPVSGGVAAAHAGTLTFMVGGELGAFQQAEPVLGVMGKAIVHAGPAGNGQAAKLCNNLMLGIQMISVCEAFLLAERLGLDAQTLFDIASKASGQCWSLTTYCPVPGPVPTSPANNDYRAGFTAAMMLKDLRLSQDAAAMASLQTPMAAQATALYEAYCGEDDGGTDFSGIVRWLRRTCGIAAKPG